MSKPTTPKTVDISVLKGIVPSTGKTVSVEDMNETITAAAVKSGLGGCSSPGADKSKMLYDDTQQNDFDRD